MAVTAEAVAAVRTEGVAAVFMAAEGAASTEVEEAAFTGEVEVFAAGSVAAGIGVEAAFAVHPQQVTAPRIPTPRARAGTLPLDRIAVSQAASVPELPHRDPAVPTVSGILLAMRAGTARDQGLNPHQGRRLTVAFT